MNVELEGFRYRFERGRNSRTLLLLHGTGADENDLVPLGRALDPDAHLLSPRGQVLENGMPRFFRRFSEGVLDIEDLKKRTDALVAFIAAAEQEFGLDPGDVIAVGFSNGANIAASVLLRHPETLRAALLLRPMVPYEPDSPLDLSSVDVLIAAGRRDPLVNSADSERLAQLLSEAGAAVELAWAPGGHSLSQEEVEKARLWLRRLLRGRDSNPQPTG